MDLVKALRAMQYCQDWQESVQAACLFAGKEYGPPVLQEMTKQFLDHLDYNKETGCVSVPPSVGGPLLEAVEEWQPPVKEDPVVVDEPGIVDHLLDRVDALEAQVALYQTAEPTN